MKDTKQFLPELISKAAIKDEEVVLIPFADDGALPDEFGSNTIVTSFVFTHDEDHTKRMKLSSNGYEIVGRYRGGHHAYTDIGLVADCVVCDLTNKPTDTIEDIVKRFFMHNLNRKGRLIALIHVDGDYTEFMNWVEHFGSWEDLSYDPGIVLIELRK